VLATPAPARLRGRAWVDGGAAVGVAAATLAALLGAVLAYDLRIGVGLLALVLYGVLAFFNLPLALVVWVPLVFFEGVPALNAAGKAVGVLLVLCWLGLLLTSERARAALVSHRALAAVMTVLLVWLTVSLAWATDLARGFDGLWQWWAIGILFLVAATCIATEPLLRLMTAAFVCGGLLAVAWSVLQQGAGQTAASSRLAAAAGDPNILAAGLVPAVVLAGGLVPSTRSGVTRVALLAAISALSAGIVATESRGALLSSLVAVAAAVVFFKGSRRYVVSLALVAAAMAAIVFATQPQAWERATTVETSGAGRTELWQVAWRVFEDNPIRGVGVNNFGAVARRYVREPGALERVERLAERPKSVHNVYLEALAETGVVGLAALVLFFGACVHAAILAARRFEAAGVPQMATLARAIAVATISMLAAVFFVSAAVARRLWILCALGPAALLVARASSRPS
jgi:hypothetical protein